MDNRAINKRDLGAAVVLTVMGLYITFGKNVITGKTFGVSSMPVAARADTYLRVLGGALLVLSLALLVRAMTRREETAKKKIPLVAVLGAAGLIVFILVLNKIGFFLSAAGLVTIWTFMFRVCEYHQDLRDTKTVLKSAAISAAFALISVTLMQLAFTRLLGVQLP